MRTCTIFVLAASSTGLVWEVRCTAKMRFAFFSVLGNDLCILSRFTASFKRRWRSSISVTVESVPENPREIPRRVLIVPTCANEMFGMVPNSPSSTALFSQSDLKGQPRQRGFKCQFTLSCGRDRIPGSRRNRKSSSDGSRRLVLILLRSSNEGIVSESNPSGGGSQIAALPAGRKNGCGRRYDRHNV